MGGNYLLTIGALALLTVLILSTNNLIRNSDVSVTESKIIITGTELAQSLIDEIKTKAFDENSIGAAISSVNDLSALSGPESGEIISLPDSLAGQNFLSSSTYDDVDDYNGYSRVIDTPIAENYSLSSVVQYVTLSNPNNASGSRTYCKRVTVVVTSPFFSTIPSITMEYAVTY